jgi:hypothetical protein
VGSVEFENLANLGDDSIDNDFVDRFFKLGFSLFQVDNSDLTTKNYALSFDPKSCQWHDKATVSIEPRAASDRSDEGQSELVEVSWRDDKKPGEGS